MTPIRFVTVSAAAAQLNLSIDAIHALATEGRLVRRWNGDHFSIAEESVHAYLASELAALEGDVLAEHAGQLIPHDPSNPAEEAMSHADNDDYFREQNT